MHPEFDLLCLLVRPNPRLEQARQCLRGGVDAETLLRLSERHSVRPRLLAGLAALSWEGVQEDARFALTAFRQAHLARSLAAAQQLCGAAAALAAHRIQFAAFKGPTLAA